MSYSPTYSQVQGYPVIKHLSFLTRPFFPPPVLPFSGFVSTVRPTPIVHITPGLFGWFVVVVAGVYHNLLGIVGFHHDEPIQSYLSMIVS
jgi:hypothetical protein